jgi:membrane carboxypeptidase/penicillin-binding protein PbpC
MSASQYLNRTCDVHYPADGSMLAADTGSVERWPGGARGWDLARVRAPTRTPADENDRVDGLQILTPADRSEFVLTREENADRIRPRASVDGASTVHWYLDGRYLGESGPHRELFFQLSEGEHQLTCMAPDGGIDSVTFNVEASYTPKHFRD